MPCPGFRFIPVHSPAVGLLRRLLWIQKDLSDVSRADDPRRKVFRRVPDAQDFRDAPVYFLFPKVESVR